jgi:hypothetical protein
LSPAKAGLKQSKEISLLIYASLPYSAMASISPIRRNGEVLADRRNGEVLADRRNGEFLADRRNGEVLADQRNGEILANQRNGEIPKEYLAIQTMARSAAFSEGEL